MLKSLLVSKAFNGPNNMDDYKIKDNGDVELLLKEEKAQQFIPITELETIGRDFFEKVKEKLKENNDA